MNNERNEVAYEYRFSDLIKHGVADALRNYGFPLMPGESYNIQTEHSGDIVKISVSIKQDEGEHHD